MENTPWDQPPAGRTPRSTGPDTASYDDFWLACLRAHSRRRTRLISYCRISIILPGVAAGLW